MYPQFTHLYANAFLSKFSPRILLSRRWRRIFGRTEQLGIKIYWSQNPSRWVKPVHSRVFAANGEPLGYRGVQLFLDCIRYDAPYHWQKLVILCSRIEDKGEDHHNEYLVGMAAS